MSTNQGSRQVAHRNLDRLSSTATWWERNTTDLIEQARIGRAPELRRMMTTYIEWIEICVDRREICEPSLLAEFVEQFARLASSLGEVGSVERTVLSALDQAITLAEDRSRVRLYR